ncbi:MAG: phosphate acyltransferase, partial [Defluviitaleaceae bacterium]|nr:phosphate acyltransferase [Defluviitaleaceae bacterium]
MEKTVTAAVDAMGGDNAPEAVIEGVGLALKKHSCLDVLLSGNTETIENLLSKYEIDKSRIKIIDAPQVIGSHEQPTAA